MSDLTNPTWKETDKISPTMGIHLCMYYVNEDEYRPETPNDLVGYMGMPEADDCIPVTFLPTLNESQLKLVKAELDKFMNKVRDVAPVDVRIKYLATQSIALKQARLRFKYGENAHD